MPTATSRIEHQETTRGGRFVLFRGGDRVGELSYVDAGDGRVIADHTWVEPSLRGHGLAGSLFEALTAWADETDRRVVPLCSYVRVKFDGQPELAHLRA